MAHDFARLNFQLVFLALIRLAVNSATRLVYPFLPAIARGLGISLDQAGLLVSVRWSAALATPIIVAPVGRGGRRLRLIACGLLLFSLGAVITAASNIYVGALVGFALMGVSKPIYDIAVQAYVADRVPYEVRARYIGLLELTWAGGLLVGAPVTGWLIDRGGWGTPFWVISILAVTFVATMSRVLDPDLPHSADGDTSLQWDRNTIVFLAAIALISLGSEVILVSLGAWLEESFGMSVIALGGLATLIAVAELVGTGGVAGFADRIGKRTAVASGMVVGAIGFLALAVFRSNLPLGMAATMVAYLGFEIAIVSAIPLATHLRPRARARFLSWVVVAMSLGRTVGAAAGTRLFVEYGVVGNAVVAFLSNVAALALFLAWVRER